MVTHPELNVDAVAPIAFEVAATGTAVSGSGARLAPAGGGGSPATLTTAPAHAGGRTAASTAARGVGGRGPPLAEDFPALPPASGGSGGGGGGGGGTAGFMGRHVVRHRSQRQSKKAQRNGSGPQPTSGSTRYNTTSNCCCAGAAVACLLPLLTQHLCLADSLASGEAMWHTSPAALPTRDLARDHSSESTWQWATACVHPFHHITLYNATKQAHTDY